MVFVILFRLYVVIKYFTDHGTSESEIQMMLNNESNRGFVWIKALVPELKKYDNQRDIYIINQL